MKTSKQKSFTLIELLVVIVIISILSSIIIFSTGSTLEKQTKMEALNFSTSLKNKHAEFLVSEWTFDGQTKAGQSAVNADVKDSWGYNNGSITGQVTVRDGEDCILGKCLEFNGVEDNYVALGNVIKNFSAVTVSLWVYPKDTTARNLLNSTPLILHYRGAGFYLRDANGGKSGYLGWNPHILPNKWSHLVATWSSTDGKMKLYLNGKKQTTELAYSGGAGKKLSSGNLTLGQKFNDSQIAFKGLIDELSIYKSALSSSEIKQNYIAGLDSLLANKAISKEEYHQRIFNLAKYE